jgi:ABC-type nickel/cobalt efflux system permease component RcnA
MVTLLSIIAIGFFLGMRHATDPDHVIAITAIVSRQQSTKRAALTGALWGLGHTITIFAVGTAIILFNLVIPVRLGLSMELTVGFMLILLGVWNVIEFLRSMPSVRQNAGSEDTQMHSHPHRHGDYIHTHAHSHALERHSHSPQETPLARLDRSLGMIGAYRMLRPLIVGVVHGLAGSAAVALLILASIRNSSWAIAYLFLFGLGTIAGMMLITMSMASTFRLVGNRFQHFSRRLGLASGLVSLAFGFFLAYQIAFVQGLFSAHPHWIPR